jgi:hypothetical protein
VVIEMKPNWKSDIKSLDSNELSDRILTDDASAAVSHFRRLLARDNLIRAPYAARLVSATTGKSIYFSRFDRDLGTGRIHPGAPLDPFRQNDGTAEATAWLPDAELAHDWETDPRELADCLKAWHGRPGWSRQRAAEELRVPEPTYDTWCGGRPATRERTIRRMMTLLDRNSTDFHL